MTKQSGPITQQYNARVVEVVPRGGVLRTTGYDVKAEIVSVTDKMDRCLGIIPLEDIPKGRAYEGMEFLIEVTVNKVTGSIDECFASNNISCKIKHKDPEAETYVGLVYKVKDGKVDARLLEGPNRQRLDNWVQFDESKVTGECVPCNYSEGRVAEETEPTHFIERLNDGKVLIRPAHLVYKSWRELLGQSIVIRKIFKEDV